MPLIVPDSVSPRSWHIELERSAGNDNNRNDPYLVCQHLAQSDRRAWVDLLFVHWKNYRRDPFGCLPWIIRVPVERIFRVLAIATAPVRIDELFALHDAISSADTISTGRAAGLDDPSGWVNSLY